MHLIIPKQIYGSKYGTTCHSISLLLCSTHALSHRPPFKKLTFFHRKKYIFLKYAILVTVYTLGPQIREQMSGPDLHVFTLKFLALKKLVFPP